MGTSSLSASWLVPFEEIGGEGAPDQGSGNQQQPGKGNGATTEGIGQWAHRKDRGTPSRMGCGGQLPSDRYRYMQIGRYLRQECSNHQIRVRGAQDSHEKNRKKQRLVYISCPCLYHLGVDFAFPFQQGTGS